jgi:8-amino-7-oxononanoate synthase
MVDDAHAMGVLGERGEGLAAAHARVDVVLGTFGKAFGSAGAFVAGSEVVRSWLENFCVGVVYSTAPAPPTVAAAYAALQAIRSDTAALPCFRAFVAATHERLRAAGFDTAPSDTHIIPIRLGTDRAASACEAFLRAHGILAVAIRAPTVPEGTARLRISLTTQHTHEHVERLLAALLAYREREAA